MKKIFIMSLGRTGSTFLCSHFKNYTYNSSCNVYNAGEFFAFWPMHFYKQIDFLKENSLELPKSFVDFMSNLVYYNKYAKDSGTFFHWVAPVQKHYGWKKDSKEEKDGYYLHDGWPYTLNMLDDFCKEIAKLNCIDFFIHKHIARISEEFGDEWSYENVIGKADCIIVNYRYSVLDSFISLMKAMKSKQWMNKVYDPIYDNKILWNKDWFIDYAIKRYQASYNGVREALEKLNKPYFTVRYEDFTNPNTDQRNYLSERLLNTGVFGTTEIEELLSDHKPKVIKQSKPREFYEDCFSNPEEFKKDYHEIKHLTTFTY
jgi:hypothetical protein